MRSIRLRSLSLQVFLTGLVFLTLFFPGDIAGQNCVPTNIGGTVINYSCNQVCQNLTFQIPHIKGTSDYTVNSITYNAYPYTNPTGIVISSIYVDDKYSSLLPISFPFCFYGQTYSNFVVGSNGIVTFEQICADANNAYTLTTGGLPQPIPYNGGAGPTGIGTTYYPRTAIMGAYHDIDPSASPLPTRRIEYNVFGTAPCRKLVVSFFDIRMFSCTSLICSEQIVMHESTGIIEVFLLNKPLCTSWPSGAGAGLAILGIQDETRTKAVAAPGKNCTQWAESNTGYRFTPSGGGSRFVTSELMDMSNNVLAIADTATTVTGLLDVSFPNFCPPAGNNQYVVRTTFSACHNAATQLVSLDTITINRVNSLNASATFTNTPCGPPNGTITVTVPAGIGTPPFTYILDGGTPVTGPSPYTFTNVAQGPHTVVVTDASGGCSSTLNVTISQTGAISANVTSVATACPGVNNGTITITPTSGSVPFTYTLDGGTPQTSGPSYTFTNVPAGPHTVLVVDNSGCSYTTNVTVTAGAVLSANVVSAATSCSGAANGTITVTPTNGAGPYQFSLDGGPQVSGAVPYIFTNVPAGSHTIQVTDMTTGCISTIYSTVVDAGPVLLTTAGKTDVLCNGGATGSITVVQPTAGTAPYEYSLDNINWQISPVFTGLTAGTYTVYYRESNGCSNSLSITVSEPAILSATSAATAVICNGEINGTITISPVGGVTPYEYSIDNGINWQTGNVFTVAAGNYTILIRDMNGCLFSTNITVTEPAALTANSANTNASCDGGNDGIINVTVAGGNGTYQYSIDGTNFQTSNIFNVAPGNYTVTVRDNLGCTTSFNATVGLSSNITFTAQTDPTICEGSSTQLNLLSNANQYVWTPGVGLNDTTIHNPVANPVVTTQYIVTATLGRCSITDTVIVNVNPAPVPDAGPAGFICYGQTYQLQASGGEQYKWTPASYLNNPNIANPVSAAPQDITYTVSIVADANGCPSLVTDDVFIDVTPPIKINTFPYDTIGYPGDQIQLLAIPTESNATTFMWNPSTGLNNPFVPNPIVTIGQIGEDRVYQVTASTNAGCKGEGYVRIRVYKGPDIYVPTGFTPNGDGRNDRLTPFPVGIKSLAYFRVFNRWGHLIFSTNRLHDGWDGTLNGTKQPSGVYVWMIQAVTDDNRVINKKGTVTLIR